MRAQPVLRPAAAADADAVADLLVDARQTHLPYAPIAHPRDDVRRWVAQVLLPAHEVTLAERGGCLVAVLATAVRQDIGWIDQLYVRPGEEGRRLGSLLLLHAHDRLPRPIRLYTFQPNAGARRFYERHGYVPRQFGDGRDNEERVPDVLYELPPPTDAPQVPGCMVRPLQPGDAEAWARYACLPLSRAHTSSTAETAQDLLAYIERTRADHAAAPLQWGLFAPDNGRLLATVGFHSIVPAQRSAEITYDVDPARWGQGLATAACRAATRWGFAARRWHRIQATVLPDHARSQRVLLRCGYVHEGVLRSFRQVRGLPADFLLYSALPGQVAAEALQPLPGATTP